MARTEPNAASGGFVLLVGLILTASLLLAGSAQAQTDPGISTTQTAHHKPATVGQPHPFTITVTNNSAPQHVGLKNFLPDSVHLVSATPSQGSCGGGDHGVNGVECDLGNLPPGGSATVDVVATPTLPGTVKNTALGGGEFGPVNRDEATITVNPAPE
jgi:uncharacterized repeat protein (TIGR01451 family)